MFDDYPARPGGAHGRAVRPVRPGGRLRRATSTASRATTACASFLASRGIELPEGTPDDPPERRDGPRPRQPQERARAADDPRARASRSTRARCATCEAARDAGLRRAVVSASANCRDVLAAAGIEDLFEARVDGVVARARAPAGQARARTPSSPAPQALGVDARRRRRSSRTRSPASQAGRAGGFGCVVGVDRVGQADALREHGADVVVDDLAELLERR